MRKKWSPLIIDMMTFVRSMLRLKLEYGLMDVGETLSQKREVNDTFVDNKA